MPEKAFRAGEVYLPTRGQDLSKWSVVACDQFTSQPEYWEAVAAYVGDAPSTLHITLPEIYLDKPGVDARIGKINRTMEAYLREQVIASAGERYLYVERIQRDGVCRRGLMGVVDLEQYDYLPSSRSLIRATEGTVLERIPPRVRVRENAALELPHIMLLIDDPENTVLGPVAQRADGLEIAYDFSLMQQSGALRGRFVDEQGAADVDAALAKLADPDAFYEKYGVEDKGVLLFAVGDGNHSLATAKECYERLKKTLPQDQWENHPARWALVEVVNVHDPALQFEPIHRVVFDVDPAALLARLRTFYDVSETPGAGQPITYCCASGSGALWVKNPISNLPVGTLQFFIDAYCKEAGGRVDYIHGDDVVRDLGCAPGNIGFLLPPMEKRDLFRTVLLDGALPRKTFSMGHAWDKRFYLESRKIQKEE